MYRTRAITCNTWKCQVLAVNFCREIFAAFNFCHPGYRFNDENFPIYGIQLVMGGKQLYTCTSWNTVIPDPFYLRIPWYMAVNLFHPG